MAEERLVWGSEKFIDAILDDMRAAAQLFEMDETEITPLTQQYINEEKMSIANHVDFIDVYKETLDRTDLPEGMSKAQAADEILMFVEAAQYEQRTQGTGKINGLEIPRLGVTDVQAQDPEFKKLFTKQFKNTPTNVLDEIPDDASELEFLKQEQDIAKFEAGYDEPIDNKFLHNYIGARQMSYGDDEL